MRIGLTGGTGRLGKLLIGNLVSEHQVVTFGRQSSDIDWTLGVRPSPLQLSQVDVLIHLSWSLLDRENDFHLNVGGTGLLAAAARDSGVPFLFISSVAALSNSRYGLAKLKAEEAVTRETGFNLRIGLVPEANRYAGDSKKSIGIYPQLPCLINVTKFKDLRDFIGKWLMSEFKESAPTQPFTLVSSVEKPRKLLSNARIVIPVPYFLISGSFLLGGYFSLRVRNFQDSLKSVVTTKLELR